MKFKLDENFGSRSARLFPENGHEVETVFQEGLSGASDHVIFQTCFKESRCLLFFDLDFADVLRFPSHKTPGIAVFRLPRAASLNLLERVVADFLRMLEKESISGRLWTVEIGRIRVHENTSEAM